MRQMPTMTSHMHPFPWAVDISSSPQQALDEMASHDIHHLPVKDGSSVVGLVSAHQLEVIIAAGDAASTLDPYCDRNALRYQTQDSLDRVLVGMLENRQRAALIMKGDNLAGIYTHHNAQEHLLKLLRELYPPGDDVA